MEVEKCSICKVEPSKYSCPRCNIIYCSVKCYQSPDHLQCSEEFYRECVEEELAANGQPSQKDVSKVYEILKRLRESDAGDKFITSGSSPSSSSSSSESLDSDDDDNDNDDDDDDDGGEGEEKYDEESNSSEEGAKALSEESSEEDSDDDDDDDDDDEDDEEEETDDEDFEDPDAARAKGLAKRLKEVNINDPEEVWRQLKAREQKEFEELLSSGDIFDMLPIFSPWWSSNPDKRMIEEIVAADGTPTWNTTASASASSSALENPPDMPKILTDIPEFSTLLSKKEPSPNLKNNLWNIISGYAATVRFFAGEHLILASEGSACLVNMCATLKYAMNFDNEKDAMRSVQIEAKTTNEAAIQQLLNGSVATSFNSARSSPSDLCSDYWTFASDARRLMSRQTFQMAALSDIVEMLRRAKRELKRNLSGKDKTEKALVFHKLFALSGGGQELTPKRYCQLIKKIQFYISYVKQLV